MKEWPKDGNPANYMDLEEEVVAALKFAYKLRRQNRGKTIPVIGPDAPGGAGCADWSLYLRSRQLRLVSEDQGRDALRQIVAFAIRLGIEQGRRKERKSAELAIRISRRLRDLRKLYPRE